MSNPIDSNRQQFQKIFEAHQQKGTLSYTDALKICSTLKLFPDLLTSQEIRRIFLTVSYTDNGLDRMTFLQFESFLKICGKQAFKHYKKKSDDPLVSYIKDPSNKRYGVSFENCNTQSRNLSKTILNNNKGSKLNLSTPKNKIRNSFFKPPSEKNLEAKAQGKSPGKGSVPRVKGLCNLLSPGIKKLKDNIEKSKISALTERKDGNSACSTSPSPYKASVLGRISKAFNDFQTSVQKIDTKKYTKQKKIKGILEIERKRSQVNILTRFAFKIWKLSVL